MPLLLPPYQGLDLLVWPFPKSFLSSAMSHHTNFTFRIHETSIHEPWHINIAVYWKCMMSRSLKFCFYWHWYWSSRKLWSCYHLEYDDECIGKPSAICSWYQHVDYWYWSARKVWPFNHLKCRMYFCKKSNFPVVLSYWLLILIR